ncbi:MAG: hypothetical protein QOH52_1485 [Pseudonocardiales bacterium]|jgi:predicted PurR-regulated permease PerM|nr:hypothetical protein [Pseudonocardiales bacterium]
MLESADGTVDEPPASAADGTAFGRPGRPLSRQSPFFRGFLGALGVLVALAIGSAVREASSVLTLILIAAFLAVGLNPAVEAATRRGMKRGWAVFAVAVVVIAAVTAIVLVVGGVLRAQVVSFIDNAPGLLDELRQHKTIARLDSKYHIISSLQDKLKDPQFAQTAFSGIFDAGLTALHVLVDAVIVFILTVYFLGALPKIKGAAYSLVPASRRDRVERLGDEILRQVGGYVVGATLVALLAGTVSLIFLLSVGLGQYALPLALMVALLDLIPLVGSIVGAAIVSIVGLATSLPIGIACIIFYLVYETLEGYVIYPRVMRSSVNVPEYVTIVAVLIGGAVAGVVGALLALPIAAAVLLLVREVWVRRQEVS